MRRLAARARIVAPLLGIAVIALARAVAFDPGLANYDTAYGLSWGADLAAGRSPAFDVTLPPTPHPLLLALGAVLAPLGSAADDVTTWLFALGFGAVVWIAFALGRELAGVAAGVVAALLAFSRDALLFWGALSFLDVPFAALVLGAILLDVRGARGPRSPGRELGVLACLALAGLLRPEAWLLGLGYLVVLERRHRRWPPAAAIALAVAAPVLWLAMDVVLTGEPLYSFTLTHQVAAQLGRERGPGAVPIGVPRMIASITRASVAVGAVAGALLGWRQARAQTARLLAGGVAAAAASALVVAAGTPLLQRYLFVPATLACALCGAAVVRLARSGGALRVAAAVLAVALVAELAVADRGRALDERASVRRQRLADDELGREARSPAIAGCASLVAPSRLAPWLSLDRGEPASRFLYPSRFAPARTAYLGATGDPTARMTVDINPDRPPPPPGPVAVRGRFWLIAARC